MYLNSQLKEKINWHRCTSVFLRNIKNVKVFRKFQICWKQPKMFRWIDINALNSNKYLINQMTPQDWLNQTFTREKILIRIHFLCRSDYVFLFSKCIICLESPTRTPPSKDIDKCPEEIKNQCALSSQLSNLVTKDQCVSWQGVQKKAKRIPRKQTEFPRWELRHPSPWLQITPLFTVVSSLGWCMLVNIYECNSFVFASLLCFFLGKSPGRKQFLISVEIILSLLGWPKANNRREQFFFGKALFARCDLRGPRE